MTASFREAAAPGETAGDASLADPPKRVTIALGDLARDIVTVTAPEQAELLELVTAQWERGVVPRSRRSGWLGGSVGSGIDPTLTGEIIYPLLTGALAPVLGSAAVAGWRRRWWRRRRPEQKPAVPAVRVTVESGQLEAVHAACLVHGRTLGLSAARALLLADAVCGSLGRAMDTPEPTA